MEAISGEKIDQILGEPGSRSLAKGFVLKEIENSIWDRFQNG